jgi:hypothetical protein
MRARCQMHPAKQSVIGELGKAGQDQRVEKAVQ